MVKKKRKIKFLSLTNWDVASTFILGYIHFFLTAIFGLAAANSHSLGSGFAWLFMLFFGMPIIAILIGITLIRNITNKKLKPLWYRWVIPISLMVLNIIVFAITIGITY